MSKLYQIHKNDNVAVSLEDGAVPFGHKVALCDMKQGTQIVKYNNVIGTLTADVKAGGHIHDHNLKTNLSGTLAYTFSGDKPYQPQKSDRTFMGYERADGSVGTRNELWVLATVGCVSATVEQLVRNVAGKYPDCDGVFGYTHPYGCSQMGEDQENTRKILASLVRHPNAGGVLIVSLGCENSNVGELKKYLGDYDEKRVKFLVTQDCADELSEGERLLDALYDTVKQDTRTPVGLDKLVLGLKCGGSDAFSGITANALCGAVTDQLTACGGKVVLTEVPEMFGAEQLLMQRCENKAVFEQTVSMINGFKAYFTSHDQACYENPSPGNHDGGITTLEEKSLGCVQKGGSAVVTDVLAYGEHVKKSGLSLLTGPGNDIVAVTNLTAAGANLILFTTGRGTPLGAPVPTVKIASNSPLAVRKPGWIDFDAGILLEEVSMEDCAAALLLRMIDVASGRQTKNEVGGYRQISIFKDGVIM